MQNVYLIDLESMLGGKVDLFTDFVHFNLQGHHAVAEAIVTSMMDRMLAKSVRDSHE